jgi:hypothetical protein
VVVYHSTDTIPISDFALAWRITDARWTSLPERLLSRIMPFSDRKSKELLDKASFDPAQYHAARQASLEEESDYDKERVQKWLRELPIPTSQDVYLCWQVGEGVAAATDWSTFVEVWDDLWYPFDRLCVFDETRQWAVVLGPEEQAVFIERNAR